MFVYGKFRCLYMLRLIRIKRVVIAGSVKSCELCYKYRWLCFENWQQITTEMGFEGLPEGCIADILSCTTPTDACRLSLVSKLFHSAAESDALWERFLPSFPNVCFWTIPPKRPFTLLYQITLSSLTRARR